MSNEAKLSQEEIDALMRRAQGEPVSESRGLQQEEQEVPLSTEERDVLGEIGNISFGSASTALSTLLQQRVEITTPEVTLYQAGDLQSEFPKPYVLVSVEYTVGLKGTNALAIELNDAKTIADLMLGGDGSNTEGELQELHLSAVAEAMNQMMGGAATSMSTIFERPINISPPSVTFMDLSSTDDLDIGLDGWVACVSFRLRIGNLIDSRLMQLLPLDFARDIVSLLQDLNGPQREQPEQETASASIEAAASTVEAVQGPDAVTASQSARFGSRTEQNETLGAKGLSHDSGVAAKDTEPLNNVFRPDFTEFEKRNARAGESARNLPLILDVGLSVTVELGRTRRAIREILELAPGSVIELDKLAGEPVDILVNNRRIAIGEVVVIDENFGVRVTDILDPVERVKKLQ